MKISLIGIGQAGGKIVDAFLEYSKNTQSHFIIGAHAVNSAVQDLRGLENVPEDNRILIGEAEVKGNGVGADNELGAEVMENDIETVFREIDAVPTHEIDAFIVVAALGGGTGSGGTPVLANELRQRYAEPVYGLGVLPSANEGSIYSLNAARSLKTCVDSVDNMFLFDNDAWSWGGDSVKEWYNDINQKIATRFGVLLSAGEVENSDDVAENVVDSSEVINTLRNGGVTSVGYAAEDLPKNQSGLLGRFSKSDKKRYDESTQVNMMSSLIRKSAQGQLTLPCNIENTEKGLVLVAGPQEYLNRKGIEEGRKWMEEATGTMEIRGGDYPIQDTNQVAAVTVFSGLYDVERIKEMQRIAVEADNRREELLEEHDERLESLISDEDEELDSLF